MAMLHTMELADEDMRKAKAQLAKKHWIPELVNEWLARDRKVLLRLEPLRLKMQEASAQFVAVGRRLNKHTAGEPPAPAGGGCSANPEAPV